jgi:hypothetical protein
MILTFERSISSGSAFCRFLDLTTIPWALLAALYEAMTPYLEINFLRNPDKSSPRRSSPQNETTVGLSIMARVTSSAITPPYIT